MDGSTVTVSVMVYAGIDVQATLDGKSVDEVRGPTLQVLEYVFLDVSAGQHTIDVEDGVGYSETAEVTVRRPVSVKEPFGDLCIPAAPLGVAVGHTWTLAGPVRAEGDFSESSLPQGASEVLSSYTVTAIEDSRWGVGDESPGAQRDRAVGDTTSGVREDNMVLVEHSRIKVQLTQVTRDADGAVLGTEEQIMNGVTISAPTLSPVLTLDWECHRQAWLQRPTTGDLPGGGTNSAEHTVEEMTLSSGATAVLFRQTLMVSLPAQEVEMTVESAIGYDKLTGLVVFITQHTSGTRNGEPLSLMMAQELVSEGNKTAEWLDELIQRLENEPVADPPASITQYDYKGRTVYFVPQRCCDIFSDLYDADGNIIGHPDGGITGQGDGRVPDFLDERGNGQLVWKDERTSGPDLVQVSAPIESVEILVMESFPAQYSVRVVSGLPNACVSFGGFYLERNVGTIRIQMLNWKLADPEIACAQVYSTVPTLISLGSDFESGGTYTVEVNDATETFIAQEGLETRRAR